MIKKAIILSAGFGKRAKPLTLNQPKPLLKIGNETLLSNTIKFLKNYGIKEIVINVHYLADQIVNYIEKNKFDMKINIIYEKEKILDTGGGILNAIKYFDNQPFFAINPDTIWNSFYLKEIQLLESIFFNDKKIKCMLLLVDKQKSFDQTLKGDFDLKDNLIRKNSKKELKFIYTGLQIIKPEIFFNYKTDVFPMGDVWSNLIKKNELYGLKSKLDFFHVTSFEIYKKLIERKLIIK